MRSPGWSWSSGTCGSIPYCEAAKWGSDTPAWAHAHSVRPEQSKATPGDAAAKRYGTPSWLSAARTAVAAPGEVAGTSNCGEGSVLVAAPLPPPLSSSSSAAVVVRVCGVVAAAEGRADAAAARCWEASSAAC